MELAVFGQAFERGDLRARNRRHRSNARPHGFVLDEHRARAALPESTAEARTVQIEIVAKDVEERRRRVDVNRTRRAVHPQCDVGHGEESPTNLAEEYANVGCSFTTAHPWSSYERQCRPGLVSRPGGSGGSQLVDGCARRA